MIAIDSKLAKAFLKFFFFISVTDGVEISFKLCNNKVRLLLINTFLGKSVSLFYFIILMFNIVLIN